MVLLLGPVGVLVAEAAPVLQVVLHLHQEVEMEA